MLTRHYPGVGKEQLAEMDEIYGDPATGKDKYGRPGPSAETRTRGISESLFAPLSSLVKDSVTAAKDLLKTATTTSAGNGMKRMQMWELPRVTDQEVEVAMEQIPASVMREPWVPIDAGKKGTGKRAAEVDLGPSILRKKAKIGRQFL